MYKITMKLRRKEEDFNGKTLLKFVEPLGPHYGRDVLHEVQFTASNEEGHRQLVGDDYEISYDIQKR